MIDVRSLQSAPARMKPVPQIGPEQPPTLLRDDHADLEQEVADRAAVEVLPILLDHAEARRERYAEVGVAGERVELAEVLLVAQRRGRNGLDRRLDVCQRDFRFHFFFSSTC